MKKFTIISICFLFVLVLSFSVFAKTDSMTLLAISHSGNKTIGSTATLELEIVKGDGRVFIETVPISRIDTQISTRFAKEIACKISSKNCDNYNFFYTIKSGASILGGPSAGSAITVLTVALLDDLTLDDSVAMSGTINSGNLVGPIGGLKEKIEAAKSFGLKKVLIPSGQRQQSPDEFFPENNPVNISNNSTLTIDLVEYGSSLGVEVVEVVSIEDAIFEFTGKNYSPDYSVLEIDKSYQNIMAGLSDDLCSDANRLISEINVSSLNSTLANYNISLNKSFEAILLAQQNNFYASASFCFNAGVQAKISLYENLTSKDVSLRKQNLISDIENFKLFLDNVSIETITDLQTYMIVTDRLAEVESLIVEINSSSQLAYAEQRFKSAESWSSFFGSGKVSFELNSEVLKATCIKKIGEAQDRINYIDVIFPSVSTISSTSLDVARSYLSDEEYVMCIFKASKSKAEANVIVGSIGVSIDNYDSFVNNKISSAKQTIIRQQQKNIFPIVAYSYYEYAKTLNSSDIYSAALYSEYALELGNIDMYFKQPSKQFFSFMDSNNLFFSINLLYLQFLLIGFILGFMLCYLLFTKNSIKFFRNRQSNLHKPKNSTKIRLK